MPENESNATPCYLSYATFKNTIQTLALEGSIPRQIDHSVLPTMGGSTRKMFLAALRFFDLVDADGTTSKHLTSLAEGTDSDWSDYMQVLLREKYPALIEQLADASPKMLRDRFTQCFDGLGASLVEPAVRFLVSAAKDADIAVSPHLTKRKVRAPSAVRKRLRKIAKQNAIPDERVAASADPVQSYEMALMAKFPEFDPGWNDEQRSAWFAAFQKLIDMHEKSQKKNEPVQ